MGVARRGADEAVAVEGGATVAVVVSAEVVVVSPVVVVVVVPEVVVGLEVVVVLLVVVVVVGGGALVVGSVVVGGESARAAATSPIPKSSMVPRVAISRSKAMGRDYRRWPWSCRTSVSSRGEGRGIVRPAGSQLERSARRQA